MDQTDQLDTIVRRIVQRVNPLQIILFGSQARGEARVGSDVDLLIVLPSGTPRRATAQSLYRHLRGIQQPFDLLVATEEDLDKHRDNPGLIFRTILSEGRRLHG
jgi:uncharacterized protein